MFIAKKLNYLFLSQLVHHPIGLLVMLYLTNQMANLTMIWRQLLLLLRRFSCYLCFMFVICFLVEMFMSSHDWADQRGWPKLILNPFTVFELEEHCINL